MRDMNKVVISGYLGQQPRMSLMEGDKALVKLSLGSHRPVRQLDGSYRDVTEWAQLVFWNGQAEAAAAQLYKGDRVLVEGRLQSRQYQDWAGSNRSLTEIIVQRFYLLTHRREIEVASQPNAEMSEEALVASLSENSESRSSSYGGGIDFDADLDADELADLLVAAGGR